MTYSITNTTKLSLTLSIAFLLLTLPAHAVISVSQSIIYIHPSKAPVADLFVSNQDNQKAYIKTEVVEVLNAGKENEKRIKTTDIDQMKLLLSPSKAIISSNSKTNFRLNYLGDFSKERIFRVDITPVVGKITSKTSAIKVLIAYQILVIISPINPKAELKHYRNNSSLTISNVGNANALLGNSKVCPKLNAPIEQCKDSNMTKRLYPDNQWSIPLKKEEFLAIDIFTPADQKTVHKRFN